MLTEREREREGEGEGEKDRERARGRDRIVTCTFQRWGRVFGGQVLAQELHYHGIV